MNKTIENRLPAWIGEFAQSKGRYAVCNIPGLSKMDIAGALQKTGFNPASTWDGEVTDVVSGEDETDRGKNTNTFPFHTDGVYYSEPPHYVILYCVSTSGTGGETFFTPSADVLETIRKEFNQNLLDSINVVYMERERRRYRHPLIEMIGTDEVLRWSSALYLEPDVSKISEPNRKRATLLIPALMTRINDSMREHVCYEHTWKPGDLLIFNNRQLVHGRTQVCDPQRERHLYRALFSDSEEENTFAPMMS
ncbi:MAG: TauD/TfdA family dioxygenase [Candidatus Zambryskibacteria bacterium]|nr:TauD/TfdA family dioxygenase [Candidatus Zambryskibacteria bacterium]